MGVDANLYIPADIDPRFISEVMGIAMGAKVALTSTGTDVTPTKSVPKALFGITPSIGQPESLISIGPYYYLFRARVAIDGPERKNYHGRPHAVLSGRANATTIAVFRRIGQVFGGVLVPSDSNQANYEIFERPKATLDDDGIQPEDTPFWEPFQKHLSETKPITAQELYDANEVSAYTWGDWEKGIAEFKDWHPWAYDLLQADRARKSPMASPTEVYGAWDYGEEIRKTLFGYLEKAYPDMDVWAYQRTCYAWDDNDWNYYMVIGKAPRGLSVMELTHDQSTGLGAMGRPSGRKDDWRLERSLDLSEDPREAKRQVSEFLKSSDHWKFHGGVCGPTAGWRLNKWYYIPDAMPKVNLDKVFGIIRKTPMLAPSFKEGDRVKILKSFLGYIDADTADDWKKVLEWCVGKEGTVVREFPDGSASVVEIDGINKFFDGPGIGIDNNDLLLVLPRPKTPMLAPKPITTTKRLEIKKGETFEMTCYHCGGKEKFEFDSGDLGWDCDQCGNWFCCKDCFKEHRCPSTTPMKAPLLKCGFCSKELKGEGWKCERCGRDYCCEEHYVEHYCVDKKTDRRQTPMLAPLLKCDVCEAEFDHDNEGAICDKCGRAFCCEEHFDKHWCVIFEKTHPTPRPKTPMLAPSNPPFKEGDLIRVLKSIYFGSEYGRKDEWVEAEVECDEWYAQGSVLRVKTIREIDLNDSISWRMCADLVRGQGSDDGSCLLPVKYFELYQPVLTPMLSPAKFKAGDLVRASKTMAFWDGKWKESDDIPKGVEWFSKGDIFRVHEIADDDLIDVHLVSGKGSEYDRHPMCGLSPQWFEKYKPKTPMLAPKGVGEW